MVGGAEAYLESCRTRTIEEIHKIVASGGFADQQIYDLMVDYPLRRAKGLRPAICIAVCRALGGALEDVASSAAVLEIYHNAFLIHDDIEDGSFERRGRPAMHREHGTATAINIGDGLLAMTLQPLLDNTETLGLGRALRVLEIIARMVRESFEGQACELRWIQDGAWELGDEDYAAMTLKKTCWYSFVAPSLIGAVIACGTWPHEEQLVGAMKSLGLAFQIQDDLLNLEEDATDYGKETAGDLWEGKRTIMLLHTLRRSTPAERKRALSILRKPRPESVSAVGQCLDPKTEADVSYLLSLLHQNESIVYARELAQRHARDARQQWGEIEGAMDSDNADVEFLTWLIGYVVGREW